MNLKLVTEPVSEPLTLTEVEGQVRLTDLSQEANTVELMIKAVRERAESITRRALITQQWELCLDSFPYNRNEITLPKPPLQKVDSIIYIDTNGDEQTLDSSNYKVYTDSSPNANPGFVAPAYGKSWPVALKDFESVKIRFTCGYGPFAPETALNVPNAILQWCLINVANLFENRETVGVAYRETKFDLTESIADGLLENYRLSRL